MNSIGFLLIIVAFGFLWFVLVRPQRRRQMEQSQMLQNLHVGDRVLTAGGIYGEIRALRDEEIVVEIAPELEVRVARRAIAGIVPPEDGEDVPEPDDDAGQDGDETGADDLGPGGGPRSGEHDG